MKLKLEDSTPILVGAGQYTEKGVAPEFGLSPMGIAAKAAELALQDAGINTRHRTEIDTIAVMRIFPDSYKDKAGTTSPFGRAENPPWAVASRLNIKPSKAIYGNVGGNTPQKTINEMAERIADSDVGVALITGSEAIDTMRAAIRRGVELNWQEDDFSPFEDRGIGERMSTDHEIAHGLSMPTRVYPLFENSIRGELGHTIKQHLLYMGEVMAPFSEVAASNPFSFFPERRSARELATVTKENRFISFPYPKWMNAMDSVNQGAAVLMTSVGKAIELGIDPRKWVFLHGCADANDKIMVSDRISYSHSPAMRLNSQKALDMAGCSVDEIRYFDIYSCFPSAVEAACSALGVEVTDPRGLTLTGGLPFFGGPGNNYSMHGVATLLPLLRRQPEKFGLISANGGRLTKHATGIYSCQPVHGNWQRENPQSYQAELDAQESPAFTETPNGAAIIETYTVNFKRSEPTQGIVVGRLENGTRFIANTPQNPEALNRFVTEDQLGRSGWVISDNGLNTFTLN